MRKHFHKKYVCQAVTPFDRYKYRESFSCRQQSRVSIALPFLQINPKKRRTVRGVCAFFYKFELY